MAKLLLRWNKNRQLVVIAVFVSVIIVIAFVLAAYFFNWDWTGITGYNQLSTARTIGGPSSGAITTTTQYQPGKSFWDWLQLLGIIAIPVAVAWFTAQQSHDLQIAADNQHEAALQKYIGHISKLLLDRKLRESQPQDDVRITARARTLTVLPSLDRNRKRTLLQFLRESGLLSPIDDNKAIINLSFADLTGADLAGVDLHEIDLYRASFAKANLSQADLRGADLSQADLFNVNLSKAKLRGAKLSGSYLGEANLSEADLREADLRQADLGEVELRGADLSQADLREAYLNGANLLQADLTGANLMGGAKVTHRQLDTAKSLKGATMPDGSKHL